MQLRSRRCFEAFSRGVLWLGDEPGLGSRLKLVANHWILNSVENLAQTLAFAEALNLDPRRFLELISGAPFDMQYAHWKAALMLEEDFPVAFALKLARKDMELALEAAAGAGIELPLAEATSRRQGKAIELGYGEDDSADDVSRGPPAALRTVLVRGARPTYGRGATHLAPTEVERPSGTRSARRARRSSCCELRIRPSSTRR